MAAFFMSRSCIASAISKKTLVNAKFVQLMTGWHCHRFATLTVRTHEQAATLSWANRLEATLAGLMSPTVSEPYQVTC
jgi:hypothetical protein